MSGTVIDEMLKNYELGSDFDKKNAMKEVIQEIVLCGLSRGGFFRKAAFYGGTALRMFYGLDRFSEDLDFSLIKPDNLFNLENYFPILEKEARSFGLKLAVQEKEKTIESPIKSAFVKGNTREHLLLFYDDQIARRVPGNEVIKIKFEVDTNPPDYATFERKYRLLPSPYEVNLYDEASLFAGKVHAVICRGWKGRVKGRDLYDYVFYLAHGAKVNLNHLRERLLDSGFVPQSVGTLEDIKQILTKKFNSIDFKQAKEDVLPFIKDKSALAHWGTDFFQQITKMLKVAEKNKDEP